jgi:hypothetical protein
MLNADISRTTRIGTLIIGSSAHEATTGREKEVLPIQEYIPIQVYLINQVQFNCFS